MRLLIVEDNIFVARVIMRVLEEAAHEIVGQGQSFEASLQLASETDCDAAIVDIDLKGVNSAPVAAELKKRGIPFVVMTGSPQFLRHAHNGAPIVLKPFRHEQLLEALGALTVDGPRDGLMRLNG